MKQNAPRFLYLTHCFLLLFVCSWVFVCVFFFICLFVCFFKLLLLLLLVYILFKYEQLVNCKIVSVSLSTILWIP